MSRFKRLSLDESKEEFPLLNAEARKALKGGCLTCAEWRKEYPGITIYTEAEYTQMSLDGTWKTAAVCGIGLDVLGAVTVTGDNSTYCLKHFWSFADKECDYCYFDSFRYCEEHEQYFGSFGYCYDCNEYETYNSYYSYYDNSSSSGNGGSQVTHPVSGGGTGSDNYPERINLENGRSFEGFMSWFKLFGQSEGHGLQTPVNLDSIITKDEAAKIGFTSVSGPGGTRLSRTYELKGLGLVEVNIADSKLVGEDKLGNNNMYYIGTSEQTIPQQPYFIRLYNNDGNGVITLQCYGNKEAYDYLYKEIIK